MVLLARLVGVFMVGLGLLGVVEPAGLEAFTRELVTPVGLWVIGGLRLAIGIVFLVAAPSSRVPAIVRGLGMVIVVAGLVTPFFGVERGRAMLDWFWAQGGLLERLWVALAIGLGGFVLWAFLPPRDGHRRRPAAAVS